MTNDKTEIALDYHAATALGPGDAAPRLLDRALLPRPYKLYRGLEAVPLPSPRPTPVPEAARPGFDAATLGSLLHYSAGIVSRRAIGGREVAFRAAACTGGLYHIEVYVVTGDLDGLAAGVHHFGAHDGALRRLREGDYRAFLQQVACAPTGSEQAATFLVLTSQFWRNAWRYEARAYRHAFWDAGTILANLLALAAAHGLRTTLLTGFVDADVNRLVGVDGEREAALCVVALGRAAGDTEQVADVPTLDLATEPVSRVEIEYPTIQRLHAASILASREAVADWRQPALAAPLRAGFSRLDPSPTVVHHPENVIARRRSARRFRPAPLAAADLDALLRRAMASLPFDFAGGGSGVCDCRVIVNDVTGAEPGVYAFEPASERLQLLRRGDFRAEAAHLALDQALGGEAAANLYFTARLPSVLEAIGNRGYRVAQLEGGIRGGLVYLSAYALGLQATGLTFYDAAVRDFFGADAGDAMFLIAAGR